MLPETILEVENLSFAWPCETMTLARIGFRVARGTKVFFHGANGAGKTTLFQCLVGLLKPRSGEIRIAGELVRKEKERMNRIGLVFQNADDQIVAGSVFEEIAFGPLNMGLTKNEVVRRVEEAMEVMNLGDLREKPPHFLSHGEKKRVAIASVLSMRRDIMILDEPTAGLDAFQIEELVAVLDRLTAEGCTLLIATHDVDFSFRCADRVIVIDRGKLVGEGDVEEILSRPDLLEKSRMFKPQIMMFYELLLEHFFMENTTVPRTMKALTEILQKARPQ